MNADIEPMDVWAKVQPLAKNFFNNQIKKYAEDNLNQGSDIPVHSHTGVDSSQVDFNNLLNKPFIQRTVTLTTAQILAAYTTPAILIPTPTPNGGLVLVSYYAYYNFNSIAYAINTGNLAVIRYTGSTTAISAWDPTYISFASSKYAYVTSFGAFAPVLISTGKAIEFSFTDANPTLGNSSITLVMNYQVVSNRV